MTGTLDALLTSAARRLESVSDSPRLDAELLLCHALGCERSYLRAHPESVPAPDAASGFEKMVQTRLTGAPIAYLTTKREFWSLPLKITMATLIPRPETELLVELALQHIPASSEQRILDLGTGSGSIALAIAKERTRSRVTATDKSEAALQVAQDNAKTLGITNVEFLKGDWFAPLTGRRFHLIVSNPPYVRDGDPHLTQGDVQFEPRIALVAGDDGLADLRRIIQDAPGHLEDGGMLMVEHGLDQGTAVCAFLEAAGFKQTEIHRDTAGHERVSSGQWASRRDPG